MRFSLAIAVSSLVFAAACANPTTPTTKTAGQSTAKSTTTAQRTTANQIAKSQNAAIATQIISELQTVRTLLNAANHDYKGHRAAAVHQVTHAMHVLQYGKNHPNPGPHYTPAKGGNREAQAISDAQLRQAMAALQQINVQLANTPGQHHAATIAAINRAIQEINQALKVA